MSNTSRRQENLSAPYRFAHAHSFTQYELGKAQSIARRAERLGVPVAYIEAKMWEFELALYTVEAASQTLLAMWREE